MDHDDPNVYVPVTATDDDHGIDERTTQPPRPPVTDDETWQAWQAQGAD